ncbi:MAG: hypothetical protein JJ863_33150 [Deltaproteobacteria bacterium]|nr:hypothetical protein [Deltaproteobacteria bacterium]
MTNAHRTTRDTLVLDVLDVLYTQAHVASDATTLALHLGVTPTRVAEALLHLETRGMADASKARLTLQGLAAASALNAAQRAQSAAA